MVAASLFGEVCSVTDRKGGGCFAAGEAERPRPLSEFRKPGPWQHSKHVFEGDFEYDLRRSDGHWTTRVESPGPRVRAVRYRGPEGEFAGVLLVETALGSGAYVPVMRWSGGAMPEARVYKVRCAGIRTAAVLTISKDYGGNVPMVSEWTWTWTGDAMAPHRVDAGGDIRKALEVVARGYGGYDTGLDWQTLRTTTWIWKGKYPGKVGVAEGVTIWFELSGDGLRLEPVRAERFRGGNNEVFQRWRRL